MSEIEKLHDQAMEASFDAKEALAHGDEPGAIESYKRAFRLEHRAAKCLSDDLDAEPTRGFLFRSAGYLALKAGMPDKALEMAQSGLIGFPEAGECRDLFRLLCEAGDELGLFAFLTCESEDDAHRLFLKGAVVLTRILHLASRALGYRGNKKIRIEMALDRLWRKRKKLAGTQICLMVEQLLAEVEKAVKLRKKLRSWQVEFEHPEQQAGKWVAHKNLANKTVCSSAAAKTAKGGGKSRSPKTGRYVIKKYAAVKKVGATKKQETKRDDPR